MHIKKSFKLLALSLFFPAAMMAQSDGELMAEGRVAMNNNDCVAAKRAFGAVSSARRDASWLDNMAQAEECNGGVDGIRDIPQALQYYEQEAAQIVGSERLAQKIGDLRYRINIDVNGAENAVLDWIRSTTPLTERRGSNDLWVTTTTNILTFGMSVYTSTPSMCTLRNDATALVTHYNTPGSRSMDGQQRISTSIAVSLSSLHDGDIEFNNIVNGITAGNGLRARQTIENLSGNFFSNLGPTGVFDKTGSGFVIRVPQGQATRGIDALREVARRCRIYYGHK